MIRILIWSYSFYMSQLLSCLIYSSTTLSFLKSEIRKVKISNNGIAVVEFVLTNALMQKAMQGETDPKQLEFYVTVEYYKDKKHTTDNVNVNNPFPPIKHEVAAKPRGVPKAKDSPAASKPASKKEEKGILENVRDWWENFELWDWGESSGTAKKDPPPPPYGTETGWEKPGDCERREKANFIMYL